MMTLTETQEIRTKIMQAKDRLAEAYLAVRGEDFRAAKGACQDVRAELVVIESLIESTPRVQMFVEVSTHLSD